MPGVWHLRYAAAKNSTGRIPGKPASAISGRPDIPCFLLLDDPANELLLPFGLGTNRIQTLALLTIGLFDSPKAILCLWAKVLG